MNKFTYDDLYRLYVTEHLTMHQVAKELGIAVGTVYNYLHKWDIPISPKASYPPSKKVIEWITFLGKSGKGKTMSKEARAKISEARKMHTPGHIKTRCDGYRALYYPDYPSSNLDGYVMEHVYIMEQHIGRQLKDDECVHHINEDKSDNRIENLKLMTKSEHMSYHATKRWAEKRRELMTY